MPQPTSISPWPNPPGETEDPKEEGQGHKHPGTSRPTVLVLELCEDKNQGCYGHRMCPVAGDSVSSHSKDAQGLTGNKSLPQPPLAVFFPHVPGYKERTLQSPAGDPSAGRSQPCHRHPCSQPNPISPWPAPPENAGRPCPEVRHPWRGPSPHVAIASAQCQQVCASGV